MRFFPMYVPLCITCDESRSGEGWNKGERKALGTFMSIIAIYFSNLVITVRSLPPGVPLRPS